MRQSLPKLARNAYELLGNLPRHGEGTKITRTTWQDNSFWTITKIKTSTDGKSGKAYGVLTWRGEQQREEASRVRGSYKKVWRRLAEDEEHHQHSAWPSLAAAALKSEGEAVEVAVETAAAVDGEAAPSS